MFDRGDLAHGVDGEILRRLVFAAVEAQQVCFIRHADFFEHPVSDAAAAYRVVEEG
jgi:hypothetical protein